MCAERPGPARLLVTRRTGRRFAALSSVNRPGGGPRRPGRRDARMDVRKITGRAHVRDREPLLACLPARDLRPCQAMRSPEHHGWMTPAGEPAQDLDRDACF